MENLLKLAGFILSVTAFIQAESSAYNPNIAPAQISCKNGYVLVGSLCLTPEQAGKVAPAQVRCKNGYTLEGSSCLKQR